MNGFLYRLKQIDNWVCDNHVVIIWGLLGFTIAMTIGGLLYVLPLYISGGM